MYNAAVVLPPWGLEQMAAKKKPSRKKASSKTRKKSAKKTASKKKVARKVAKKAAKKKVANKKASKKKVVKKKVVKKKVSKKPSPKRKSVKKVSTKTATKSTGSNGVAKTSKTTKKTTTKKATNNSANALIHGIAPYKPKKGEEYMNDAQLEHFRAILTAWKQELMQEVDRTVHHMQDEASNFPDPNDRATQESEFGLELRTRDRERKLLKKIASALSRVDDASYGYCEETGEEIGLQRLEARPVATLCVEAQERRELAERQYSDRDDR